MKHLLLAIIGISLFQIHPVSAEPSSFHVNFSPHGGCTEAVVNVLNAAKSTVLVQASPCTTFLELKRAENFPPSSVNQARISTPKRDSKLVRDGRICMAFDHAFAPVLQDGKEKRRWKSAHYNDCGDAASKFLGSIIAQSGHQG